MTIPDRPHGLHLPVAGSCRGCPYYFENYSCHPPAYQCVHGPVPRSLPSGSDKPSWCPLGSDGDTTTEVR